LALLGTTLCVAGTVARGSRDRLASLLAGVAFALAPPAVECYYTLSKPEVPLALWLGLSLWAWAAAREASADQPRRARRPVAVSVASLFLAYFTKETAQATLLASALWVAGSSVIGDGRQGAAARIDRWYLGANLGWTALFWIVRAGTGTADIAAGDNSRAYAL